MTTGYWLLTTDCRLLPGQGGHQATSNEPVQLARVTPTVADGPLQFAFTERVFGLPERESTLNRCRSRLPGL
jgi:hypothetical protein